MAYAIRGQFRSSLVGSLFPWALTSHFCTKPRAIASIQEQLRNAQYVSSVFFYRYNAMVKKRLCVRIIVSIPFYTLLHCWLHWLSHWQIIRANMDNYLNFAEMAMDSE